MNATSKKIKNANAEFFMVKVDGETKDFESYKSAYAFAKRNAPAKIYAGNPTDGMELVKVVK